MLVLLASPRWCWCPGEYLLTVPYGFRFCMSRIPGNRVSNTLEAKFFWGSNPEFAFGTLRDVDPLHFFCNCTLICTNDCVSAGKGRGYMSRLSSTYLWYNRIAQCLCSGEYIGTGTKEDIGTLLGLHEPKKTFGGIIGTG